LPVFASKGLWPCLASSNAAAPHDWAVRNRKARRRLSWLAARRS